MYVDLKLSCAFKRTMKYLQWCILPSANSKIGVKKEIVAWSLSSPFPF